jgi:hypothetical protein
MIKPFQPATKGTIAIANSTSASASAAFPSSADTVALYNSSSTATAFFRCDSLISESGSGAVAVAAVPGTPGDFPVPPLAQIRISVSTGPKKFSTIASAADGTLYITPGVGN